MGAIKALFTYDYGNENMNKIRALGYEVKVKKENSLIFDEDIRETEVLVCYNPFLTFDIGRLEALKWIQLSSIGIDQVPMDKVVNKNIVVTNNKGGYSIPMGEWIVLKILELLKQSAYFYKNQQEKKWKINTEVLELHGRTIGFIGTGTIAVEAAKRLQGFGVRVLGVNTTGKPVEYFDECYSNDNIEDMLSISDIVIISIPSTNETIHMIDETKFKVMKDGVLIVNIARGNILDEAQLLENIQNGKIKGAALDVFEDEPLSSDNPLWQFENVIITPHNSWISEMRNERRFETIYENMKRYAEGKTLINVVNLNKGY